MKMNKILAVLLSVAMLCAMIPVFSLTASAAGVGEIVNGDFETGSFSPWDADEYGFSIHEDGWFESNANGDYSARIGSHSSVRGTTMEQIVPVNTNATYKLTFVVKRSGSTTAPLIKVFLGNDAASCTYAAYSASTSIGSSFTSNSHTFSTGSYKYAKIQFVIATDASNDCYLDDVSMAPVAGQEGDAGTHAKPTLKSFGTEKNRPTNNPADKNDPAEHANNVIKEPGFESTTNAQWNTSNFLKQGVSVVSGGGADGDAHAGSKFLKYYHGSVAYTEWPMFEFACPAAGEYVFSAWVRTPHLSSSNVGAASIGIINPDTGKFLTYGNAGGSYDGHYSNPTTQLRSTATDDDWHLRSVTFYVGAANSNVKIGIYGLRSTMYVDDISVHLLANGVKYVGDQQGALSVSATANTNASTGNNIAEKYCASENNLIPDCNMNSSLSSDFWTVGASGWNNGFLEFSKDAQNTDRGTALHFKGTNPVTNKKYRYIKFVSVEPNTSYTVSFDYRVVKTGSQLMFIDNNINKNATFHTPNLTGNSWGTYAFTFTTGNYNRIGIVFQDGNGEAYYDDFRFFKMDDGISSEPAEEVFPTLKPTHPDKGVSRMEMSETDTLGLAFMFNLKAEDMAITTREVNGVQRYNVADYTNGKVEAFKNGTDYKLITAGAMMTNDPNVGQNPTLFVREKTTSNKTVIDVNATYLWEPPTDEISYVVRIVNIPESHKGTTIYARPYYVFQYEDQEVVVYGDIVYDAYEEIPDINDGWLEWD